MTDIFVKDFNSSSRTKRRGIIALVIIAALVGAVWYYWFRGNGQGSTDRTESNGSIPTTSPGDRATFEGDSSTQEATQKPLGRGKELVEGADERGVPEASLDKAKKLLAEKRLLDAKEILEQIRTKGSLPSEREAATRLVGDINIALTSQPKLTLGKTEYIIKKGDTLWELAREFNTTVEAIRQNNQLKGNNIYPGNRIFFLDGDFSIFIDKSDFELTLYLDDQFFKRYRIATGNDGSTPAGKFKIGDSLKHPTWYSEEGKIPYGDPRNILGTHWLPLISLEKPEMTGYGIHGTSEPENLGSEASQGCIRMKNEDIEEIYTLITKGVPVVIQE